MQICKGSRVFNFVDKILLFITNLWLDSLLCKVLCDGIRLDIFFEHSVISKWLMKFLNSITKRHLPEQNFNCIPEYLKTSLIFKLACEFFGMDKNNLTYKQIRFDYRRCLLVIGLCFVCMTLFGAKWTLLIVIGSVFATLILFNTMLGVLLTVFCLALMPTKVIILLIVLSICSFLLHHKFLKPKLIDLIVMLMAFLFSCSVFISYIPSVTVKVVFVYLLFISFYFVLRNIVNTKDKLFLVTSMLIASSIIVGVIGVLQKYWGLQFTTDSWLDAEMFAGQTRVFATFANPNVFGEYLLFVTPIAFASLYYFKRKLKLVSLFATGLLIFCMLLTLSRGTWLGLLIAVIVFGVFHDKRILYTGFLSAFMLPFMLPQSLIHRFMSIGNLADSSTSYRVNIWIGSLRLIKDFWPIGIGSGTDVFALIYQKYSLCASYAQHSHNLFLQLVIDFGITGLILFGVIIFLFYRNTFVNKQYVTDDFINSLRVALTAGMTGFIIQSVTDNTWYNYKLVLLFWIVIAMSASCYDVCKLKVWDKFKYFSEKRKHDEEAQGAPSSI